MSGAVFIWLTATRPLPSWPEPSPLVSLNHGRCAGALAWVRIQTLCLPASVLMASINSRALLESPAGAGAFIVTVAISFLLQIAGARVPDGNAAWRRGGEQPSLGRRYSGLTKGLQRQENRAARGIPRPKRHSARRPPFDSAQ